jgi:UDP-N-acetylmuramoylalanine--D-glutamate ligase
MALALDGARVLVVGAGKSGVAAATFCAGRGARVTLTDARTPSLSLPAEIALELGGHKESSFVNADLIVLSPGVPAIAPIAAAQKKSVAIVGEVELAARFITAPLVGVTGTNGKSTVTALAGEIARQTGRPTFVGGNLGTPLITCVGSDAASARGIVVVELSSFQLETADELHPRAAALLNVTPDHLDRYPDMAAYTAAKLRIAQRQRGDDVMVVNADDDGAARPFAGRDDVWRYSVARRVARGGFVDGAQLVLAGLAGGDERYPIAELHLVGRHNLGNTLAALLLLRASGLASYDEARRGLGAFHPLPHRMQLVGERDGVRFYDDSKATNVDSVVAGVDGFPTAFVLIAGGRDKGGSYAPLVAALRKNSCRAVVLIGEAAPLIEAALAGAVPSLRAATMDDAVRAAAARARPGDAVVLSPACSSYDMFDNYEHRGRVFRGVVEAL